MAAKARQISLWDAAIIGRAVTDSFVKLDPRVQIKNPVMFIVEVGSLLTTGVFSTTLLRYGRPLVHCQTGGVLAVVHGDLRQLRRAVAEGARQAQADTLRKRARKPSPIESAPGPAREGAGCRAAKRRRLSSSSRQVIPTDGEIVEGIASVDESAITGESAPVIRESGGDRSAVTGGTRVLSDWIKVRATSDPGHTFLDRMIALVEGAERQKTPNEIALNILLAVLTLIFLMVVVTLQPFAWYAGTEIAVAVLISLLVCLIPTTIGALISAIGIAGMDRLIQHNVLAMSGRAVEAAGDVDVLLLDKTGTITWATGRQ
jgi:K+-transporting ATPase ATPase B chain